MNRQADFTDGSSSFDDGFDKLYEKIKDHVPRRRA